MGGQRDIKGRENPCCYLFGGKRLGNCIFFSQNASTYLCIVSSSGYRMHPQEQAFKEESGLYVYCVYVTGYGKTAHFAHNMIFQ